MGVIETAAHLTLRLSGPLRLLHPDGRNVTPPSLKAQGILALLATSPALRRPRAWLQDKLWSDSAPEQGAASLRQTTLRLRREVAAEPGWLVSGPGWIGLDPGRVAVALDPAPGEWGLAGEGPEFCDGLDIADPEFEDWIRDQRLAHEDRLARTGPPALPPALPTIMPSRPASVDDPPVLLVAPGRASDGMMAALAETLATEIATGAAHLGGAEVRIEGAGAIATLPADALRLKVNATRMGAHVALQAQLSDPEWGTLIWVNNCTVSEFAAERGAPGAFDSFVAKAVSATMHELGRGGGGPKGSTVRANYKALAGVFSFDGAAMRGSDAIFAMPRGHSLQAVSAAWRAQLRVFSIIERSAPDLTAAKEEAIDLASRALADDPLNPVVRSIASEVALFVENRPQKAMELALAALERGPYSPLAHSSLAQAQARLGNLREAHEHSLQALRLSSLTPSPGLWYLRSCVTALRCGSYEEATRYAQLAHETTLGFKAPLRFLAALQFHQGNDSSAAGTLQKLKDLETDFSLELMASENYPVESLRETALMAVTKSALI